MTSVISSAAVEHASTRPHAADRDQIVLTADEVRWAYDFAIQDPRGAIIALSLRDNESDARSVAKLELAADVALKHGLAAVYTEPSVSHSTSVTSRRPSPVVQRDEHGNKVVTVDSSTGGFRVAFVEREDGSDVHPMVALDVDDEMDERHFAVMVAHLVELVREIDPTGTLRFAGEKAVQAR